MQAKTNEAQPTRFEDFVDIDVDLETTLRRLVELGLPDLGEACLILAISDSPDFDIARGGEPVVLTGADAVRLMGGDPIGPRCLGAIVLGRDLAGRLGRALRATHALHAYHGGRSHDERLATTAHDLMSPLAFVKGTAQLLRRMDPWTDPDAPEKLRARLAAIDDATTRIADTLTEVVQRARPSTVVEPSVRGGRVDLVETTRRVVAQQQLCAEDHSIRLLGLPPVLLGTWNEDLLERMITNLVGNAVKYSSADTVVYVSLTRADEPHGSWAVLRVSDEGIGIPASDLPFVFDAFRRGSNVETFAGSGLGLASVSQTVRHHNGQLSVDSVEGQGTCVTVRLPLDVP